MSVAADMASILAGFHAKTATFGTATASGRLHTKDVEVADGQGGTLLRRMTALHLPAADFATAAIGDSVTVAGLTYRVHDVRLLADGEIRELLLAR
jgi:transketolase N-terminal domain/subunit